MTDTMEQANRTSTSVLLVDEQLQALPQSELMKVAEVFDLLLDLRNAFIREEST